MSTIGLDEAAAIALELIRYRDDILPNTHAIALPYSHIREDIGLYKKQHFFKVGKRFCLRGYTTRYIQDLAYPMLIPIIP